MADAKQQLFFDVVELHCKCGVVRKQYPTPMLKGASQLVSYMKDPRHMGACLCGALTCTVKARMRMSCGVCGVLMPLKGPCEDCGWVAPDE